MKRRLTITALCALTLAGCSHAPPTLSPAARAAYGNTRVLKVLDLIRDTAVDGNAKTPPIFSEAATRKVVTFHRLAIVVMNASQDGWQAAVKQGLDELLKDKTLLPSEVDLISPYVPLVKSLIDELAPVRTSEWRRWATETIAVDMNWLHSRTRRTR